MREMARTTHYWVHAKDVAPEKLADVEGVKPQGDVSVKVLHVGEELLVLEVRRSKGLIDPVHKHDDHETTGYLISGRMRVIIGDEEFIAEPGTSWVHPRGVEHYSEALEDCLQLEIKSPPKKTWRSES